MKNTRYPVENKSVYSSVSNMPAMSQHHKTTSNQFQYNSHLKRHSLQRILIEKDGTSSISKFMEKNAMQDMIDYDVAGVDNF